MRPIVIVSILFFMLPGISKAQVPVKFHHSMDSLYFRSETTWITLTPFFFAKKEFSPDKGRTWQRVGMLGQNVRPFVIQDSLGRRNINNYKIARIVGITQMWVACPLLLYKHFTYDPEPRSADDSDENPLDDQQAFGEGGYLTAAILIFGTGALTYHLLSRNFLYNSLERIGIPPPPEDLKDKLYIGLRVDPVSGTPQLALGITF